LGPLTWATEELQLVKQSINSITQGNKDKSIML